MLGVIILSNVMRTGFMLRDKIQNEIMLSDIVIRGMMSSVIKLSVIMLNGSMLKDILLNVVIANVKAPCCDDISNKKCNIYILSKIWPRIFDRSVAKPYHKFKVNLFTLVSRF